MRKHVGALAAAVAMMGDVFPETAKQKEHIDRTTRHEVIPNGCKKYYFYSDGDYVTSDKMVGDGSRYPFTCIASNDDNAKRKFKKWQDGNQ